MEKRNIYKELSAPLPKEAKQIALNKETHKGYDTIGQGYQYCVDRFNEVLGVTGWSYNYRILSEDIEKYSNGKPKYIYTIEVLITIKANPELGLVEETRKCIGGHDSITKADALKGAITNGFKKTASFFGVGREAYAGELDDDFKPNPYRDDDKFIRKNNNSEKTDKENEKIIQMPKPKNEPKNEQKTVQNETKTKTEQIHNDKISKDILDRIQKAHELLGEDFNIVLKSFNCQDISDIPNNQVAINILTKSRELYSERQ